MIKFLKCDPSSGVACAEQSELDEWMSKNNFSFDTLESFVNMDSDSQDVLQFVKNRIWTPVIDMHDLVYLFDLKEIRVKF